MTKINENVNATQEQTQAPTQEEPTTPATDAQGNCTRHVDAQNDGLMNTIRTTGELSKESEEELKRAIQSFTEDFLKLHEEA